MSEYFFSRGFGWKSDFCPVFFVLCGLHFSGLVQFDSGLVQVRETHAIATVLWTLIDLLVDDLLFS
jgi:hypothetical protein